jgi:hypothetical protein
MCGGTTVISITYCSPAPTAITNLGYGNAKAFPDGYDEQALQQEKEINGTTEKRGTSYVERKEYSSKASVQETGRQYAQTV